MVLLSDKYLEVLNQCLLTAGCVLNGINRFPGATYDCPHTSTQPKRMAVVDEAARNRGDIALCWVRASLDTATDSEDTILNRKSCNGLGTVQADDITVTQERSLWNELKCVKISWRGALEYQPERLTLRPLGGLGAFNPVGESLVRDRGYGDRGLRTSDGAGEFDSRAAWASLCLQRRLILIF